MKTESNLPLAQLILAGYCITSRASNGASRIDRPNWQEYMAKQHSPWDWEGDGMEWVNCLGDRAADQYRRVYSRDHITVPDGYMSAMTKSSSMSDLALKYRYIQSDLKNKAIKKELLMYLLKHNIHDT